MISYEKMKEIISKQYSDTELSLIETLWNQTFSGNLGNFVIDKGMNFLNDLAKKSFGISDMTDDDIYDKNYKDLYIHNDRLKERLLVIIKKMKE